MKPFSETGTWQAYVSPMDDEQQKLEAEVEHLARTIADRKAANETQAKEWKKKPTLALEQKQSRLQQRLSELKQLDRVQKLKHYDICRIRAEQAGTIWTVEARDKNAEPRALNEGWGEKGVKHMLGLPTEPSSAKRDLPCGEVKDLDNGNGGLQNMQIGKDGSEAYNGLLLSLNDAEKAVLRPEVFNALKRGEVPKQLLEDEDGFPSWLARRFNATFKPSAVLSGYGDIYAVFEFGYVVIPAADADEAWEAISVTKSKPRYFLKKEYSLRKMLEASDVPTQG